MILSWFTVRLDLADVSPLPLLMKFRIVSPIFIYKVLGEPSDKIVGAETVWLKNIILLET